MMEDQLMIFWRRGETSFNFFSFAIITLPCSFSSTIPRFLNFVTILSILGNIKEIDWGLLQRGDNEASAKYVYLCYNEENIKNGEKRVNRKLQTRFCGGSSL